MKKLLVPTDFSKCASNAVECALKIAQRMNAEIHFLHFTGIPIDWINLDKNQEKLYPDITRKVKELNHQLDELVNQADSLGIPAQKFLGYNESYFNIVDHIKDEEIDMVIMGSHGASGAKEFFIGSVAQRVVRLSPVPVLVVKNEMHHVDKLSLVIVSDFDERTTPSFDSLLNFARVFDAEVHLVFINTPANFTTTDTIEKNMEPYIEKGGDLISSVNTYNALTLDDGIQGFLSGEDNPIVAMMTHGRTGIKRLIAGSVTESVMNHVDVPFLSVQYA